MCADLLGIVFPHLETVRVERVWVEDGVVRVKARTLDGALPCPSCGVSSYRVHSRYRRHLADAAVGGHPVVVDLLVRRLFCDVADCARRTFAEQVEGLTIRYGRRTVVLVALVRAIALALMRPGRCPACRRTPHRRQQSDVVERADGAARPDPSCAAGARDG